MSDFTLDDDPDGRLAGDRFRTASVEIAGAFREIKFSFTQAGLLERMAPHFFELHYHIIGPSED